MFIKLRLAFVPSFPFFFFVFLFFWFSHWLNPCSSSPNQHIHKNAMTVLSPSASPHMTNTGIKQMIIDLLLIFNVNLPKSYICISWWSSTQEWIISPLLTLDWPSVAPLLIMLWTCSWSGHPVNTHNFP